MESPLYKLGYALSIVSRAESLQKSDGISIAAAREISLEAARESIKIRSLQAMEARQVVLIGASMIGVAYSFILPLWRVAGWVIPVIVGAIIGSYLSRQTLLRLKPDSSVAEVARMEIPYFAHTLLNTLIMGSGIWWTGYHINNHNVWFITTTIAVLYSLGALINSCTNPPTYFVGTCCNLGLIAAFWLTTGAAGIAVAITILGLVLLFRKFAYQLSADFMKLIKIRFENSSLNKELEIKNLAAETARREAEQANLSKSQFLAAASHDLRQPLHALMLFSNLLDNSSAEQRKVLINHIRAAAESLNHLFSGLLDLSKLDAGAITPQLTNVNLAPLLESLASEFGAKARQKGLAFEMQVTDIAAITDPFLVERVLRNLLDNAVKYTSQGFIKFSVLSRGATVKISVEDSGIGVAEKFQEQIFSEFFQIDNPARNSEHGTGLGLSIVRRLCDLMGHRQDLKSATGVGSCFSIELLSAALPDTHNARVGAIDHSALRGLRVLIVDDDSRVRFAMERLLQSWHCQVITAATSSELMALVATPELPHALIADYRLAESKTGFDVIRDVRQQWPAIPAAIFTGDTEAHWREAEGMADVPIFQKPVEADQIARWLIQATAGATLITA